ncbi:MAG: PEP/pyruvate-binding domain-containing protein [Patescibacteria group bacterium]
MTKISEVERFPREKHGAKAANLEAVGGIIDEVATEIGTGELIVPEFIALSSDTFDSWKYKRPQTGELYEAYKWMKQVGLDSRWMVRSSAVLSEDDGDHMAAGVYESVMLPRNFTSAGFFKAVKQVYESTDSEAAKNYMQSIGIDPDDEKMGIVLQKVPEGVEQFITCNTVIPGNTNLSTAHTELARDRVEDIIRLRDANLTFSKKGLENLIDEGRRPHVSDPVAEMFFVPPDFRILGVYEVGSVTYSAMASTSLARHFDKDIQTEIVSTETGLNIVQARPLPESMVYDEEFCGFPDEGHPVYAGRANKVMNGVTAICEQKERHDFTFTAMTALDDIAESTPELNQLIAFDGSFARHGLLDDLNSMISMLNDEARSKLVFLVARAAEGSITGGSGGHLETFFSEIGIPCVFYDPKITEYTHTQFVPQGKVRIYSNGVEARIYPAEKLAI